MLKMEKKLLDIGHKKLKGDQYQIQVDRVVGSLFI